MYVSMYVQQDCNCHCSVCSLVVVFLSTNNQVFIFLSMSLLKEGWHFGLFSGGMVTSRNAFTCSMKNQMFLQVIEEWVNLDDYDLAVVGYS